MRIGMPSKRRFLGNQVHSTKNIVQAIGGIAAAATQDLVIADAVDASTLADVDGVDRNCIVNTVYLEVWLYGAAADNVNSPIDWYIAKNPGNNLSLPDPTTVGSDDNKRWVFAMGKGLVANQAAGNPPYLIRGWFSIPKRYRKMNADDQIVLRIDNNTAGIVNFCFLAIYKWYK